MMLLWGSLAGGAVGGTVLASGYRLAQELGWTRMDIPFLLGTIFTENRRAAAVHGAGEDVPRDRHRRRGLHRL